MASSLPVVGQPLSYMYRASSSTTLGNSLGIFFVFTDVLNNKQGYDGVL